MLSLVDVRLYWDDILPGIKKIKDESQPEWRIEDVYASLVSGVAELYVDLEQRPNTSFIVLQEKPLIFKPGKSLLVWIAYDDRANAAKKYMEEVEMIAETKGCSKVEFWTPWDGLVKALNARGYNLKYYIVEKEI
tara:strand:+ start:216 stop:620 length:405 start_codon:yes stop_codon:yes gene_type:complete